MGRVPGLFGVLAESPNTLKAYTQLHQAFSDSSFDAEELTVVWQTINVEHECHYCVPAHTGIAHSMKVDPAITEALRFQFRARSKPFRVSPGLQNPFCMVIGFSFFHNIVIGVIHHQGFT